MKKETTSDDAGRQWDEHKSRLMEASLGKEHDTVLHAIIPFAIGGALDLYFYPNGLPGTAIATKELALLPGQGSSNKLYRTYELVMFTKQKLDLKMDDQQSPFGQARRKIAEILNPIARYSAEAQLNPNETCEFPVAIKGVGVVA